MDADPTKRRLVAAAEACFAAKGYAGTSLREITAAAKTNVAAVSYHFGGKEQLYVAVFERRIGPVNAERLRLLDALEAEHTIARPLPLEPLLDVFLRPALVLARSTDGQAFLRIVGRLGGEEERLSARLDGQFDAVKRRFLAAFRRALPGLPLPELFWRMHFVVGSMLHTMSDTWRLARMSNGLCDPSDPEAVLQRLVPFAAAALRAPLAAAAPRNGARRRRAR